MSRGPGRIEQVVDAAFTSAPDSTFTIEQLAALAYPGLNRIDKRHRVAILRASRSVCRRCHWDYGRSEAAAHPMVYFNRHSVRSFGLWHVQVHGGVDAEEAAHRLDDPNAHGSRYAYMQPGGTFVRWVEIHKARDAGDDELAETLYADLAAAVNGRRTV